MFEYAFYKSSESQLSQLTLPKIHTSARPCTSQLNSQMDGLQAHKAMMAQQPTTHCLSSKNCRFKFYPVGFPVNALLVWIPGGNIEYCQLWTSTASPQDKLSHWCLCLRESWLKSLYGQGCLLLLVPFNVNYRHIYQLSRIWHWFSTLPYGPPNLPYKMDFWAFLCFSLKFSPFFPQNSNFFYLILYGFSDISARIY